MSYRTFLRRLREYVGPAPRRPRPRKPTRKRPQLEALEDRTLPSVSATLGSPSTSSVGTVVNVSKRSGNQQESTIAVNPTNPDQMAVISNVESANPGVFAAYSSDAGATWTGRIIGSGTGVGGDGLPSACCDPQAAWDQFGNLFLTYLDDTDGAIEVLLSSDGGKTFAVSHSFTDSGGTPDQPSIAVGAGSVWVDWTDSGGNVEAAGARVTAAGAVGTWTTPQVLPNSANGDFGGIAIGPTGQVLVTYQYGLSSGGGPDKIVVNLDAGGLTGTFASAVQVTTTQVGGIDTSIPAMSNNFGIDAEANLAWDRSGGPHNGRVYLVYTDAPSPASSATTTYVRHSDDNGATWSARVKVNDDKTIFSKFLPSISVDQSTGAVGVAWYDCRNDHGSGPGDTDGIANTDAEMFAAVSSDGGQTFSPNVQLSPKPSNSDDSEPPDFNGDRPLGYGDFQTSDFADGAFYRIWADNSNSTGDNPNGALSKLDLYTARLTAGPETVTVSADPGDNTITVRLDPTGNYIDIYQNVATTGQPTFIAARQAVKNIVVQGGTGNDHLIVDIGNGNPLPSGGLSFTGGGGTDSLVLQGVGMLTNEVYTGGGSGSGTITLDNLPLSFSGVSSYADSASAISFTVNGTAAGDAINVVNAPAKVNGFTATEVNCGASPPTFLAVDFAEKVGVTVSGAAGSDTVTLNNPTPAAAMNALTIDGGSGDDQLNVQGVAAGVTTTARDLSGNDTINVSSDAPTDNGTLAGLAGRTLSVDVDGVGTDTLNISERGRTTADSITVNTANHLISSATLGWAVNTSASAAFAGGIHLFLGSGNDSVSVSSTAAGEPVTVDGGAGADTYNVTAANVGSGGVALDDSGGDFAVDSYTIDAGNKSLTLTTGGPGVLSYQVSGAGLVSQDDADDTFGISLLNVPANGLTLITNGGGVADGQPDSTVIGQDGFGDFSASINNFASPAFLNLLFPMAEMHQVEVGGTSDSESLLLDFSHGSPIPASNLFSYNPGTGDNSITLQGGSFSAETDAPTGAEAGSYSVTDGGQTFSLTYSNVLSITDTVTSAALTIDGTTGADAITVNNGPKVFTSDDPSGTVTTTVGSASFALVDAANKATLGVAGLGGNDSITLSTTTPGPGLTTLSVTGGAGNDLLTVLDTAATYTTTIDGNGGSDTVVVGNTLGFLGGGLLSFVRGPVQVADTGGSATLDVDDGADATGRTVTVSGSSVAYTGLTTVSYANVGTLNVYAGRGKDTINVSGTNAATTTSVSGGGGNDSFHIGSGGTLDNLGPLTLDGGTGSNTATFDDSAQTTAHSYTLTSAQFSRTGGPTVGYSNLASVGVSGGSVADSFDVTPAAATAYAISAGSPATPPGDTLTYEGSGTLTLTADRAGTVSAAGVKDVTYTDVETVGASGKLALQVNTTTLGVGGNGTADAVLLQGAGTGFDVSVNGTFATAGATANYSSVAVTGSSDNDTLTVDFAGGNPVPSGGVSFTGGGGTDSLVLQGGGTIANEVYTPGSTLGSGTVTVDGAPVSFSAVSSYKDSATATNFTVNGTSAGEAINVVDAPVKVNGAVATEVNGGTSPTFLGVDFANKTNVTVSGQGGGDTFTVNNPNPAAGLTGLKAVGGTGADSFAVTATGAVPLTLDGGAGADTYAVAASGVGTGGVALDDSGTDATADLYNIDAGNSALTLTTGGPGVLSYQASGAGPVNQNDADGTFGISLANVPADGLTLVTNGGGVADGVADTTTVGQDGSGDFSATLNNGGGVPFLNLLFPMAEMHQVEVNGTADADTLVVDFTNGSPIPMGGFSYDGGGGSNSLVLQGGSFTNSADTPGSPSTYSFDAASLTYANVATITDTNSVTNYTVSGGAAATALGVADGPNGTTQVTSSTSATVEFASKQHVTVAGQGGNDTLTLNNPNPAPGLQSLALDGGGGSDSFDVTPSASVAVSVDGGNPTTPPGDTLTYEGGGTVTPSGTGAAIVSATGVQDVSYTGIETFQATGSLALRVSTLTLGVGGDSSADTVLLQGAGTKFNVSVNGTAIIGGKTSGYTSIAVVGSADADTLAVDFTNGNPVPSGGLSYDGGGGSNALVLKGGSFAGETITPSGPEAGTVALGSSSIAFQNTATVTDTVIVTNFTAYGTTAADTVKVIDAPTNPNLGGLAGTEINAGAGATFAAVDFANKTDVFVSGQGGGDAFTVNNPHSAAGLAALEALGGAGADTFTVTATGAATIFLDGGAGADSYTVTATGVGAGGVRLNDSGTDAAADRYVIDANNQPIALATGAPGVLSYQSAGAGVIGQVDADGSYSFGMPNIPSNGLTLFTNGAGVAGGTLDGTSIDQDGSGNFAADLYNGGASPFLSLRFPMAQMHAVHVGGTADSDTLQVDFTNGSPIPAGGFSYDGGGGSNNLILQGGSFTNSTDTPGTPTGTYTFDGSSLTYANVATILDTDTVTNYTVSGGAAATALGVADGPNGTTQVTSSTSATVDFASKQHVTVAGQGGNDTLTLNNPNPAPGLQSLALDGGNGNDSFDVTPSASVAVSVDGGNPTTPPGDTLTYEGTGSQTVTGTGAGSISGTGVQDVSYTGIETVNASGKVALQVSMAAAGFGSGPDAILLQGSGANFSIFVNGSYVTGGVTADYSSMAITGSPAADTLTVDFTNGNPVPSGGVSYFGNGGSDALALKGGSFAGETINPNTAQSGTVALGSSTVAFTGVGAIDDAAGATDLTIRATSAAEPINIVDDPAPLFGSQASLVNSGASATFAPVHFAHKTNVSVLGVGGSDTFTQNNPHPAAGLATLALQGSDDGNTFLVTAAAVPTTIDGGGGNDTVTLHDDSNSLAGITGALTVNAQGGTANVLNAAGDGSFTLTDTKLTALKAGVAVTLDGHFQTANLTGGPSAGNFDVSGWHGNGTLDGSANAAGNDTVTATSADANFTLGNAALSRTGRGSMILVHIGAADLTDTGGGHTFDASGWRGAGTLTGGPGRNDTLIAQKDAATITLANGSLAASDGTNLALANLAQANLTGGSHANAFDLSGWTGTGSVTGGGGSDTVTAGKNTPTFTLADNALTTGDGMHMALAGVGTANLTGTGATTNAFDVSGWTGTGSLAGGSGSNTVSATKDQSFTLADNSLAAGTMSLALFGIRTANLADGPSPNGFDVSGWTGAGSLTGGSGSDTVTATKNFSFTLADTRLQTTDTMNLALVTIHTADLSGGASDNAFDVSGWHGNGALDGQGGTDAVTAASNADFLLDNGFLTRDGGFSTLNLQSVEFATLTNTGTAHSFDVGGWTHPVSLSGAGSDSVTATHDAGFTLTDTALTDTGGLSATLAGITNAGLKDGPSANAFDVSGWTHPGSLTGGSGSDTVTAGKDTATFTLANSSLTTGDGMRLTLTGIGAANLSGTGATNNTFEVSGWTGTGSLTGGAGSNTVAAGKNTSFTLADGSLTATDGMVLSLSRIGTADLSSGTPGNDFNVSGWTGGGRLVGGGGPDSVTATKDASFVLTDTELTTTDGMDMALVAVRTAFLAGGPSNNAFDVSGWHGGGSIDGGGGTNTILSAKDTSFTLRDTALAAGDGMALALAHVQVADLTGGVGNNTFDVSGWSGGGTINGGKGGADEVVASREADFSLSDAALTGSGGLHLALAHVGLAALTGGPGANAFTVSGWSGAATLDGAGGPDSFAVAFAGSGAGSTTIRGTGGQASLVVSGTSRGDGITVAGNQVSRGAETVTYTGVGSVTVRGGSGANRVTVLVADGFVSNLSVDAGPSPASTLAVVDATGGGVFHFFPSGAGGLIEAHYLDGVLIRITYAVASGQVVAPAADPTFVQSLLFAIFGRAGGPDELAAQAALLQGRHRHGSARRQLVERLEKSPEGRRHRVEVWTRMYLGRDATDFEMAHYGGLLRSHTEEEVLARLLLGSEFFAQAGGTVAGLEALALRRLAGGLAGPSSAAPSGGGHHGSGLVARVMAFLKNPTLRVAVLHAEYGRLFPAGSVAGPAEAGFTPQAARLDLRSLRVLVESSDIFYAAG